MQETTLFLESLSAQPSLIRRLGHEFIEAGREFRKNPRGYIDAAIHGGGHGNRRSRNLFQFGLAISVVLYTFSFSIILVLGVIDKQPPPPAEKRDDLQIIYLPDFAAQNTPMPEREQEAHGGGGGGNNTPSPPSNGLPPPFSPDAPIVAPTSKPALQPPLLAIDETLLGDPSQNIKRDELIPTGVPGGVIGPPSDGPGANKGIGSGEDGGVGSGRGPGFGPGRDGGRGGGIYAPGGRSSNGDLTTNVDTRPLPLNRPRPNYTEQARRNKVQGVVRTRVLVDSDGAVKQVKVLSGLPDGLVEEAIRAAYQMRFKPAMKNGRPVSYWMTLEIEFNLR